MKTLTAAKSASALARRRAEKSRTPGARAAPEEQAAWLAELVASSDDAIIGKSLKGIVTSWNRGAQQIFGYAAEEAIGRSILFLIPADRRQEEESILSRIAAGRHVEHYETIRVRKDGSLADVSITVSPIKDASGRIIGASKIARDISDRKKSAQLLLAAHAALLESEKQILAVSETERRRIGADLHDNLGQQLTAIELLCHSLREDIRDRPELESQVERICGFLRDAIGETRRLAHGLMPLSLDADGLAAGLAEMVRQMSHGSVRCDFVCVSEVRIGDPAVASNLFHIAQEAVNNAAKHGRARKVTVTLAQDQRKRLTLRIEDDGTGFPASRRAGPGAGLRIMRHRANVIGATLDVKSRRGKGVTVRCALEGPG